MEIMALVFGLIFMLIFYFKFVITSRFISTSYVFFYRNLIKRKSKLNILFINKKCNLEHPRLKPIAISFFIGLFILLLIFTNAIITISLGQINEKGFTYFAGLSLMIILLIILIGSLIYCEISNRRSEKDFEKYSQDELNDMRIRIEEEWPNFFSK
ncbi:MAG: hypothetical protein ACI318_03375 [Bacilli bacterium]